MKPFAPDCGTVVPSTLAVLRLTINSNFVGRSPWPLKELH